jgi:CelD/BcsL family acetyltransferase involved in cellulose biosynthesis
MLEFVGSGVIGSDYLDVIVRSGYEPQVVNAFCERLDHTSRLMQLSQVRSGASVTELLAQRLTERGWTVSATNVNVCPFVDVRGRTWEGYLAGLSSSHRYNFQRRLKALRACPGFRIDQPAGAGEAVHALDVLMTLHGERWEARPQESEAFTTESIRAFHREFVGLAFERGWLRLLTMWIGNRPVAALYGLRYANVFSFYQSGFDPEFSKQSVGLVMMGLAIRAAIEEGCTEYDLLHGAEDYKLHWTRQARDLSRIELFPAGPRAQFYRQAIEMNRALRRVTHKVLQKA